MLQVLWLTSWYPNKFDVYHGDFIKRHAQATAAFCKIDVVHVQLVPPKFQHDLVVIDTIQQLGFSETIIYLRQSNFAKPINKIIDQFNYEKHFKRAIKQYIFKNKLPTLLHVHVPVKAGKLALWVKRKFNIKYVLTEHYGIYNNDALYRFNIRSSWFKYLTKQVIDNAAVFLPVSKNLGEAVNAMVTTKKYQVVYNVVDTFIFNYQPQKNTDYFWFAHASTMGHPKNPEGLLRAFAKAHLQNNTIKLKMIGTPNKAILNLADTLQLNNSVVFTGMLPQNEVAAILQQSHAFILFSNYENMPCAIAEALCCGLPIIGTKVGGIPEIITDKNGILIDAKDEDALVNSMLTITSNYHKYNNKCIADDAYKTFCYEVIGKEIANIYNKTIC